MSLPHGALNDPSKCLRSAAAICRDDQTAKIGPNSSIQRSTPVLPVTAFFDDIIVFSLSDCFAKARTVTQIRIKQGFFFFFFRFISANWNVLLYPRLIHVNDSLNLFGRARKRRLLESERQTK